MAPMPTSRYDHSCGLVTHPELGHELVVAGGYSFRYSDTVDIYTVNTDSWREGKVQTKSFGTIESYNLTCELQQIVCQNQSVRPPLFPIRIASSSSEVVTGMMGCSSTKSIGMMLIMMNGSRRKLN